MKPIKSRFKKVQKYPLNEFWEKKLNIKYSTELEYYKKFCGLPYKYKILLNNSDSEDITYENWKCHILRKIKNLTTKELVEYSRFLNQRYRDYDTKFILTQTIFVPLIFCLVTICFTPVASSINIFEDGLILYYAFLGGIIVMFWYLLIRMSFYKKDEVIKNFYKDMKEIVDEYLESKS